MPSRAKRRRRRSATLMLRVLSSTSPSRFRKLRSSQTLTALRLPPPSCPIADALGVVAVRAERARAAGADPLVAARVAPFLLREPLLQRFHQLVPAAQRLDLRLVLGREQPLELLPQPLLRNLGADVEDRVHALEIGGEREVVAVEQRLVLDERGARQMIEIVDRQRDDARLQRFEQRQELARRHRQARGLEMQEEADQHRARNGSTCADASSAREGSSSPPATRAR